jgi:hypothetical protein
VKLHRVEVLLVLLNLAALAAGAAWGVSRLRPEALATPVRAVKPSTPRAVPALSEIRITQVEAAPLFSPARSPQPEPAASTAVPAAVSRPAPLLRGVASAGGTLGAMLEGAGGMRQKLVFVGQEYDGWTVTEVGQRTVRLSNGTATAELALRSPVAGALPASAPASSANH